MRQRVVTVGGLIFCQAPVVTPHTRGGLAGLRRRESSNTARWAYGMQLDADGSAGRWTPILVTMVL